ncbi:MAG TPA: 4-hydroxy-3-methylbut-2-enyl diphosphate reductase [Syntrophorhabdaceae bacterium]
MKNDLIITIDGPSGAGKSTVARMLARALGYTYIDTGAMYRGVALAYVKAGKPRDMARFIGEVSLEFEFVNGTKVTLERKDITPEIRTPEISLLASKLSQNKEVREYLWGIQREMGKRGGIVLEGRDTGSVVFPDAHIKFFLDAKPEERAKRRHMELSAKGPAPDFAVVLAEMVERDRSDSERDLAPLIVPEGAVRIDTTGIDARGVVDLMVRRVVSGDDKPMEIIKTAHAGFCFGVKRAINMVLREREKTGEPIYTIGPIIHNPQMVRMLQEKGISPVDDVTRIKDGIVVFRTHGIKKEEKAYIREKNLRVIDATCPFVKRVRNHALGLEKEGYTVVIVGDEKHPEVKSVLSYLRNGGIVLQKSAPVRAKKIGVVSQTTLDTDTFTGVARGLMEGAQEIRIYNTICESTQVRQKEAAALSSTVDVMLIVGGKNSSNTTKLYTIVKKIQPGSYHIETEEDLRPEWFTGAKRVGITGGASTPDLIIDLVERRVNSFRGSSNGRDC